MSPTHLLNLPPGVSKQYFSKSDHEVCFFRHVPHHEDPEQPGHFELVSANLESGEVTELQAFNERNASGLVGWVNRVHYEDIPGYDLIYRPPIYAVSPDGFWLTWLRQFPTSAAEWTTAALDGSATQHRPRPGDWGPPPGYPLWFPDSGSWAALSLSYEDHNYLLREAKIHSLADPESEQRVSISEGADGLLLGMDETQSALFRLVQPGEEIVDTVSLQRVPLRAGRVAAAVFEIGLPHATWIWDVVVSPDGKQLAWVLSGADLETNSHEIWQSGLDGQQMRLVVSFPEFVEASDERVTCRQYHFPDELAWLPGGKRLSFTSGDALWSVPTATASE